MTNEFTPLIEKYNPLGGSTIQESIKTAKERAKERNCCDRNMNSIIDASQLEWAFTVDLTECGKRDLRNDTRDQLLDRTEDQKSNRVDPQHFCVDHPGYEQPIALACDKTQNRPDEDPLPETKNFPERDGVPFPMIS